jgi:8-oxo-dGTP diphosphatase
MDNFRNAAKAFIVRHGKLLLLKRRPNDPHMPETWDNPGGRLELGENPYSGLLRETNEETGLSINILLPLDVHYFVRDDGQQITLIVFLCELKDIDSEINLSEEHTEYLWKNLSDSIEEFPEKFQCCVGKYLKYIRND